MTKQIDEIRYVDTKILCHQLRTRDMDNFDGPQLAKKIFDMEASNDNYAERTRDALRLANGYEARNDAVKGRINTLEYNRNAWIMMTFVSWLMFGALVAFIVHG